MYKKLVTPKQALLDLHNAMTSIERYDKIIIIFLYFICLFQFKLQRYITSLQEKKKDMLHNNLYCNNCVSYNTFLIHQLFP